MLNTPQADQVEGSLRCLLAVAVSELAPMSLAPFALLPPGVGATLYAVAQDAGPELAWAPQCQVKKASRALRVQ